jgi:hypothetical protein
LQILGQPCEFYLQVALLPLELLCLLTDVYLPSRLPPGAEHATRALALAWGRHPTSLRVKELFETVETCALPPLLMRVHPPPDARTPPWRRVHSLLPDACAPPPYLRARALQLQRPCLG